MKICMLFIPRFFYARQHICQRVYATPMPSVCPSVTRVICVKTAERIIEIFYHYGFRGHHSSFSSPRVLAEIWGFTPNGGAKYKGCSNFDQYAAISRKRCIRSTPCLVLGYGFRGQRIEWCYAYLRFDKIQDGSWRPSWNDGAVARNRCVSWAFLFQDAGCVDASMEWTPLQTG